MTRERARAFSVPDSFSLLREKESLWDMESNY